jgi:hypothetical protein
MQKRTFSSIARVLAIISITVFTSSAALGRGAKKNSMQAAHAHLDGSTWPMPAGGLWRTSAVTGAGLPRGVKSKDLVTRSVELPSIPFYGVTFADDAVYILGGSPAFMPFFLASDMGATQADLQALLQQELANQGGDPGMIPYLAKVDLKTFHVQKLDLPPGPTINYIGGIVSHEDGKIYVVDTSELYEIDPAKMVITRQIDLPTIDSPNPFGPANFFTTYNGIQISPGNGDIILKSTDFTGLNPIGPIFEVDPATMTIHNLFTAAVGTSRMTAASQHGKNYLYLPGLLNSRRFEITGNGFTEDVNWSKPYRSDTDGTTQGTAMVYMGQRKSVVWSGNGTVLLGVMSPLGIYSQSTVNSRPVVSERSVATTKPGGSFFMPAGDPFRSGMLLVQDAVNNALAGWQSGQNGRLRKVWENDRLHTTAGAAISSDSGQIYIDDRRCDDGGNCRLYLVVLDLATGKEIARTRVAGTVASIAHIFIGKHEVFFIASEIGKTNGYLTGVRAITRSDRDRYDKH